MTRALLMSALLLVAACGDLKYEDYVSPTGPPPGSTTTMGSVSVAIDGESFSAPLQTGATWRNNVFGFAATNASVTTRTFALSVRLPGPGTYAVGGPNSPVVSLNEFDRGTWYRWFCNSVQGAGSVTVSFLTTDAASGMFSVELIPDSATKAAGFTEKRYLTGGTFSVAMSR